MSAYSPPKSVADPSKSGYVYYLGAKQQARLAELYSDMYSSKFAKLEDSNKFKIAEAEEQTELLYKPS